MEFKGILTGVGVNENGYAWIDIDDGFRFDLGKDGWNVDELKRMLRRKVEGVVVVSWVRSKDGKAFPRRRVLSLRVVE